MAKGNILVNGFTGKLGNMVFAKINGQEIARGYNPSPKVSYTTPQCLQRGKMKSLVLMWQLLTGGKSFKFAFGDKKAKQSDYNRFVQLNMLQAPVSFPNSYWVSNPSFEWFDDQSQPHTLQAGQLPFSGQISQGSVATIRGTADGTVSGSVVAYGLDIPELGNLSPITADTSTVKDLKDIILGTNTIGLQAGDKVTVIGLYPDPTQMPVCVQMVLGTEQDIDSSKLTDLNLFAEVGKMGVVTKIASAALADGVFSMSVIISRKDMVNGISKQNMSNSYMCLSPGAQKLLAAMSAPQYLDAVAKAWGESLSYLQSE